MTLIDFILKAKLSGYASRDEGKEKKFNDGSVGFEILTDEYRYLDRYNGFNPFAGSEQIFDSNNGLLWVMNYFGEVLPNGSNPKGIYSFLREAMLLISPDYPFRGPAKLEKQDFIYENQQYGSVDSFHGIESIYENNDKVYVLYYHGGKIQKAI
ncbi:MAG: hypothetical protein GY874_08660 [Desulfobacteraceae bacterium]|nr:hypothetical protein [Desulfobacteraceae bacterium]